MVGVIAQSDWKSREAFQVLGKPMIFVGITDSMVNRFTSSRSLRAKASYYRNGQMNLRPNRAKIPCIYMVNQVFKWVPILIGENLGLSETIGIL